MMVRIPTWTKIVSAAVLSDWYWYPGTLLVVYRDDNHWVQQFRTSIPASGTHQPRPGSPPRLTLEILAVVVLVVLRLVAVAVAVPGGYYNRHTQKL